MEKIAVFPGSFDPITIGHEDIILRALPLFDKLIIAIGYNSTKTYQTSPEVRKQNIEKVFRGIDKIEVDSYTGLTVDYCKSAGAGFILRGLRTSGDFEFERNIGLMNLTMAPDIETIYLLSRPEYSAISSTVVRDIIRNNGDYAAFLPKALRP